MKSKLLSIVISAALFLSAGLAVFAASAETAEAKSLGSYAVSMEQSGRGKLYWNYGRNMEFFIDSSIPYNEKCTVQTGTRYQFSGLVNRGFVAEPEDGWYFDGVYNSSGKKAGLNTVNIDLIRLTRKGVYYYDYIPSYSNPEYSRLTEKAYKELMKTSLKALYGIRTYKKLGTAVLYELPKKDAVYYPKFKKKEPAAFPGRLTLKKDLQDPDFYAAGQKGFTAKYSSSSSRIIKIDPKTGLCRITGPGTVTLTVKVPASEKTLAANYKVKVTILPEAVAGLSAKRSADKKSATVTWKGDSRCSGYEIQFSDTKNFSKITAKKTAVSGKTTASKVTTSKSALCRYVRVRPYKTSGGKRLYGPYVIASVK